MHPKIFPGSRLWSQSPSWSPILRHPQMTSYLSYCGPRPWQPHKAENESHERANGSWPSRSLCLLFQTLHMLVLSLYTLSSLLFLFSHLSPEFLSQTVSHLSAPYTPRRLASVFILTFPLLSDLPLISSGCFLSSWPLPLRSHRAWQCLAQTLPPGSSSLWSPQLFPAGNPLLIASSLST